MKKTTDAGLDAESKTPMAGAIQRRLADTPGQSARIVAQPTLSERIHGGERMTAQRKQMEMIKSCPVQRQEMEEEQPLQGRFDSVQRQTAEEEEPLQGKFVSDTAQLQEDSVSMENNTGLPDNLKSGIENLSGIAMDDVKVHYNSPQPAQLQALAYAQGTDIHVGPGQEQHLPHEAWHVVQQKQGRVQPTIQAKGTAINDDRGLEHEADVMGAQAMQHTAASVQRRAAPQPGSFVPASRTTVQMARAYMRAVNEDARVGGEVDSLRRVFEGEVTRDNQVNTWVDGFAGMPTVRYVAGKQHYYSPVGYELELSNDSDVLANFSGDGNTNDIPVTHDKWLATVGKVMTALDAIPHWKDWATAEDIATGMGGAAGWNQAARNYFFQEAITNYFTAFKGDANSAAQVATVRNTIKRIAGEDLAAHYGDNHQNRFIGTGLNPGGMDAAEANAAIPYTESVIHAKFGQVVGAWYNANLGAYSDAQAGQPTWKDAAGDWEAARKTSAEGIKTAFDAHGANLTVKKLKDGVLS